MTLNELKERYRTLIGIEVFEINQIESTIYVLIKKHFQNRIFTNLGLEKSITENINQHFDCQKIVFFWFIQGLKDETWIRTKEYIFHLSDTLMISKINHGNVTTIYIHGKKRLHLNKRQNVIIGDINQVGDLRFAGFDLNVQVPDLIEIDKQRLFCMTPIPCIVEFQNGIIAFQYFFEKYNIQHLKQLKTKLNRYGNDI